MFLRQLYEQPRVAVMAFGRMNPPTIGHQKLVDKVKSVDGDHYVFLSQTQKPKTDPLDFTEKLRYAKFFFPAVSLGHDSVKTPIQALQKLQELGYTDIVFVAGSDRVEGFQKLFDTYNGQPDKSGNIPFKFNSIKVVSAGERDPDADGAEGMSASKMRQAAADGDIDSFRQGVPRAELADEMFASVRKGMGLEAKVTESIDRFLDRLAEAATADDAKALKQAILDFQKKAGIAQDGQVGPETRAAFTQAMQTGGTGATASGAEGDGTRGTQPEQPAAQDQNNSDGQGWLRGTQGQEAPTAGPDDGTRGGQQPNTPAPAQEPTAGPDDGTRGGQQPNAPAQGQEAPTAGPDDGTRGGQQEPAPTAQEPKPEKEQPAAQPKVSSEKYMQMGDNGPGLANFNVKQMKAKYPKPYLDIPNDDGTVTRAYGPEQNLQAFIDTDKRGQGLKLSGGAGSQPADDAQQPDSTPGPDDGTRGTQEPAQTTPTDGAEQPGQVASQAGEPTTADDEAERQQSRDMATGADAEAGQDEKPQTPREKTYDVNGQAMSGNDISKRINALLKKAGITGESAFRSAIARVLTEALTDAEKQELQSLVNAVQGEEYFRTFLDKVSEKLKSAGINYGGQSAPTQEPTAGPDDGSRGEPQAQADADGEDDFQSGSTYKLDGKDVSRDEYEKTFGKDLSGRANDYNKLKNQIEGLAKQARDEKQKFIQDVLDDPDSKYYQDGIDDDPESPEYAPELKAIDDKYKAKGERLQAKADELIADPEVKKFIDDGGKDDFDKLLDGDDDKWDDLFKTDAPEGSAGSKGGEVKSRTSYSNTSTSSSQDGTTTSGSSSSSSTVTTSGGTSKTVTKSGGGATTRFSARYRDTDESKELKAQARAVRREEMPAFRREFEKNNPDAGRFDYTQDPGYEELEKKREDLLDQAEEAREMIHPSGQMDPQGNIEYYGKGANKDGTWDGEQFDPNRKAK